MGASATTHAILICTAALGIFNLIKDWDSHGSNRRRYAVLLLIVAVCLLGIVNVAVSERRSAAEKRAADERTNTSEQREKESAARISTLEQAVESGQKAQEINNRSFLEQLNKLYTKAESEHLRKEIRMSQQRILQNLNVEPAANLLASFDVPPDKIPVTRQRIQLSATGAVEVPLVVFNNSEVTARPGECVIRICQSCRYVTEPTGTRLIKGAPDTDRSRVFEFIVPHSAMDLTTKITPPFGASDFLVGLTCGCQNCSNNKTQELNVLLDRRVPRT